MTYTFDGYNYAIMLLSGERLSEAIEQFCQETRIEGGWVSGIGAAQQVTLGCFDLENKQHVWKDFDGLREIVSLTGNLAADEQGKMMFHLHGALSDPQYQTIGGHVKDLVTGVTIELFVHRSYQPLHRKYDESVGIQILDL